MRTYNELTPEELVETQQRLKSDDSTVIYPEIVNEYPLRAKYHECWQ